MKELVYSRLFLPAVEREAGRPCIDDGDHHATFSEHASRVLRLADALRSELGVGPHDRFAVLSHNSHRFFELHNAGFLGAGVMTPLNLRLGATELAHVLDDSGAEVLFAEPFLLEKLGPMVARRVVALDGEYESLVAAGRELVPPEPEETDPAALVYTGGTTGLPRGVVRSQRAEVLNVYHAAMSGGVACRRGSTFLHQAPMFHATALVSVASAPAFGVRSVVIPGFDPEACLDAIERYRVDETVLVPTMIQMLFAHPGFSAGRMSSLRLIGYGAMPMPASLMSRLRELLPGVQLVQGFGMTEAGTLTMLQPEDHGRPELLASVGRAVPGVRLSIQDLDGSALPPGEDGAVGEICVQGGNLLDGYWNDPDATAEAFRDGWYRTGDVGRLDGEGYLYLVDRLKDMIITGGENVYSVEVESVISRHPAVAQVAVIGVPDPKWGERVHAVVVPRPGELLTPEGVIGHARQSLAGYKVPKTVTVTAEPLPMSAAMKPLKRELRRRYGAA
ncbi:MAG TPA: AMP-binding protein [Acidimicrobiales bacterium]|nr:AMP-binding protein [Acidimicrobiales bacterium]